jgi:7-cyano-7-deazaguanine tRNA-ribosyltransferase
MLRDRTVRLREIAGEELPCRCMVCSRYSTKELLEVSSNERERLLAMHNLSILWEEFQEVRLRIREGTLWEYIEEKCGGNVKMREALLRMIRFRKFTALDPETMGRIHGIHITTMESLSRPEITRYWHRLLQHFHVDPKPNVLVIDGDLLGRPYSRDPVVSWIVGRLGDPGFEKIHLVIYDPALGPVPYELGDLFPTAQIEYPRPLPYYMRRRAAGVFLRYLRRLGRCSIMMILTRRSRYLLKLTRDMNPVVRFANDEAHARAILEEALHHI